jgi:hypothetical protein
MHIWPPYEAFYIDSMLFSSSSAGASVEAVAAALTAISEGTLARSDLDEDAFLNQLQNVILQGATLSRFFWPVRKGHEARGEQLRTVFGVTDSSPLRDRGLRNALEHFDERLDLYLQASVVGHIIPRYVGPTPVASGVPLHVFRAFYSERGVFALLGEEYEMQPLADDHNLLLDCAEAGSRFPPREAGSGASEGAIVGPEISTTSDASSSSNERGKQ